MTQPDEKTGIRPETYALFGRLLKLLQPPPDLTLSQWADEYRYLSQEFASKPGRCHTDRAPYQWELMDAVTDIHVKKWW